MFCHQPCSQPAASIVLEDACFLGTLFAHLRHTSQISSFLYAFEDIRRTRYSRLHDLELDNQRLLQLPPGPERRARDATWLKQKKVYVDRGVLSGGDDTGGDSGEDDTRSEENHELRRQWMEFYEVWGYDARDEAEGWWVEWGVLRERALEAKKRADEYLDDDLFDGSHKLGL